MIVTGAGSGIGRATVLALAEVGRPVAAWDVHENAAVNVVDEARSRFGVAAVGVGIDVRDTAGFDHAIAASRSVQETMPTGACQCFYECSNCKRCCVPSLATAASFVLTVR